MMKPVESLMAVMPIPLMDIIRTVWTSEITHRGELDPRTDDTNRTRSGRLNRRDPGNTESTSKNKRNKFSHGGIPLKFEDLQLDQRAATSRVDPPVNQPPSPNACRRQALGDYRRRRPTEFGIA